MESEIKKKWEITVDKLSKQFGDGELLDVDGILFLIGVQELGSGYKRFNKNQKMDVIHVAICTLLAQYGYYSFQGLDEDGWPHYTLNEKLPALKPGAQSIMMKEAIVQYFDKLEF